MLAGSASKRLKGFGGAVLVASLLSFLLYSGSAWSDNFEKWDGTLREWNNLATQKTEHLPHKSNFTLWLDDRGISTKRHPIVTIGDSKYLPALRNLRGHLEKWEYGNDLVVLCLDQACADEETLNGWRIHLNPDKRVMDQVAEVKFTFSIELLDGGYDFVFLDGDVYLTGARDPFDDMLPLSNTTWDIQFQKDFELPRTDLNIGWFYARANNATKQFLDRSYRQWLSTGAWDQGIMNDVAGKMEGASELRIHRLDLGRFRNYMLEDHEANLFGDDEKASAFINASAMIHYTCVETNLKNYFGPTFGGSTDLNGFYSDPSPTIGVANISGTTKAISQQIAFAMQFAQDTKRDLIWPHNVAVTQQRPEGEGESAKTRYIHRTNFPGVRVVDYARASKLGVELKESRFLENQHRSLGKQVSQKVVVNVTHHLQAVDAESGHEEVQDLKRVVENLEKDEVPILDFASFHPPDYPWLRQEDVQDNIYFEISTEGYQEYIEDVSTLFEAMLIQTGVAKYTTQVLGQLQLCRYADYDSGCLSVCAE